MNEAEDDQDLREAEADEPSEQQAEALSADDAIATRPIDALAPSAGDKRPARGDQALSIMNALKEATPEKARIMINGTIEVMQRTDETLLAAHADVDRRKHGMWLGAGMATASVVGGAVLLTTAAPAAIGIGLLCVGTACIGATFAIITGKSVGIEDFSRAVKSTASVFSGTHITNTEKEEGDDTEN